MNELILLRGPRKQAPESMEIKIVKKEDTDLTGYSFLCSNEKFDEWVPTDELHLYQKVLGMRNK